MIEQRGEKLRDISYFIDHHKETEPKLIDCDEILFNITIETKDTLLIDDISDWSKEELQESVIEQSMRICAIRAIVNGDGKIFKSSPESRKAKQSEMKGE